MAGAFEALSTINSFVRTLLALAVVAAITVAGWLGYSHLNKDQIELENISGQLADAQQQLDQR